MSIKKNREENTRLAFEKLTRSAITYDSLREALSSDFSAQMSVRYGKFIAAHNLYELALDMTFDEDPKICFRISWALAWLYFNDRTAFTPYVNRFLDDFLRTQNPSVLRSYTKMLCDMMRRGLITLTAQQNESVVEKCFDQLIRADVKVAVKVWCMEILYDLRRDVPWVNEHFAEVITRQMDCGEYSPAYSNHTLKVLRRLARDKK